LTPRRSVTLDWIEEATGWPRLSPRGPTGDSAGPRYDQEEAPTPTLECVLAMPSPHPIDVHVGLRIRQRRILLGMTKETLGAAIGPSFQMIQKYEIGLHSVPAGRLSEVAKAVDVPPSLFFEGPRPRAKVPLYKRETRERVHAYLAIPQSDGEGEYCRDDSRNCHDTSIAPPRFLNSKASGRPPADRRDRLPRWRAWPRWRK
jgi:transcriptional regulator with XRE-family HTH domain